MMGFSNLKQRISQQIEQRRDRPKRASRVLRKAPRPMRCNTSQEDASGCQSPKQQAIKRAATKLTTGYAKVKNAFKRQINETVVDSLPEISAATNPSQVDDSERIAVRASLTHLPVVQLHRATLAPGIVVVRDFAYPAVDVHTIFNEACPSCRPTEPDQDDNGPQVDQFHDGLAQLQDASQKDSEGPLTAANDLQSKMSNRESSLILHPQGRVPARDLPVAFTVPEASLFPHRFLASTVNPILRGLVPVPSASTYRNMIFWERPSTFQASSAMSLSSNTHDEAAVDVPVKSSKDLVLWQPRHSRFPSSASTLVDLFPGIVDIISDIPAPAASPVEPGTLNPYLSVDDDLRYPASEADDNAIEESHNDNDSQRDANAEDERAVEADANEIAKAFMESDEPLNVHNVSKFAVQEMNKLWSFIVKNIENSGRDELEDLRDRLEDQVKDVTDRYDNYVKVVKRTVENKTKAIARLREQVMTNSAEWEERFEQETTRREWIIADQADLIAELRDRLQFVSPNPDIQNEGVVRKLVENALSWEQKGRHAQAELELLRLAHKIAGTNLEISIDHTGRKEKERVEAVQALETSEKDKESAQKAFRIEIGNFKSELQAKNSEIISMRDESELVWSAYDNIVKDLSKRMTSSDLMKRLEQDLKSYRQFALLETERKVEALDMKAVSSQLHEESKAAYQELLSAKEERVSGLEAEVAELKNQYGALELGTAIKDAQLETLQANASLWLGRVRNWQTVAEASATQALIARGPGDVQYSQLMDMVMRYVRIVEEKDVQLQRQQVKIDQIIEKERDCRAMLTRAEDLDSSSVWHQQRYEAIIGQLEDSQRENRALKSRFARDLEKTPLLVPKETLSKEMKNENFLTALQQYSPLQAANVNDLVGFYNVVQKLTKAPYDHSLLSPEQSVIRGIYFMKLYGREIPDDLRQEAMKLGVNIDDVDVETYQDPVLAYPFKLWHRNVSLGAHIEGFNLEIIDATELAAWRERSQREPEMSSVQADKIGWPNPTGNYLQRGVSDGRAGPSSTTLEALAVIADGDDLSTTRQPRLVEQRGLGQGSLGTEGPHILGDAPPVVPLNTLSRPLHPSPQHAESDERSLIHPPPGLPIPRDRVNNALLLEAMLHELGDEQEPWVDQPRGPMQEVESERNDSGLGMQTDSDVDWETISQASTGALDRASATNAAEEDDAEETSEMDDYGSHTVGLEPLDGIDFGLIRIVHFDELGGYQGSLISGRRRGDPEFHDPRTFGPELEPDDRPAKRRMHHKKDELQSSGLTDVCSIESVCCNPLERIEDLLEEMGLGRPGHRVNENGQLVRTLVPGRV